RTLEGITARARPGALGRLAFETSVAIIRERVCTRADPYGDRVQSGIHRDQEEGPRGVDSARVAHRVSVRPCQVVAVSEHGRVCGPIVASMTHQAGSGGKRVT